MARLVRATAGWFKKKPNTQGIELTVPPKPLNGLLETIFRGERNRLTDLLKGNRTEGYRFGVSLIAVLRRRG